MQTRDTWSSAGFSLPECTLEGMQGSHPNHEDGTQEADDPELDHDQVDLTQRTEFIDAQGRIHEPILLSPIQDWVHDIEAFLPSLSNEAVTMGDLTVQIISGQDAQLKDVMVRVRSEELRQAEQFRLLMQRFVASALQEQCRCFLARFRFVQDVPLIIAVQQLRGRQVPQLIWYRSIDKPAVKRRCWLRAEISLWTTTTRMRRKFGLKPSFVQSLTNSGLMVSWCTITTWWSGFLLQ